MTTCNTLITSFWYLLWWNNNAGSPPLSNCNFPKYFKKGNQCHLLYSQNPALNQLNVNAVQIVSLCLCSVHFNMIRSMPNSVWSFLMFCNRNCVWLHYLYMHAVYPPSHLSSLKYSNTELCSVHILELVTIWISILLDSAIWSVSICQGTELLNSFS